jgi:tetratricopeptide (TPR) repeat protein
MGIANARAGHVQESVDAFQNAANVAPLQEEHWLNLTRELMEVSRYSESIAAVQEGLTSNPKSYALHLRLGAAYLAAGRYKDAESAFRDLVSADDPLPTSYVGLAQVQLRTGHPDEAISQLSAAEKKLGPAFLISYFLGLAFERAGKRAEALSAFQNAAKLKPDSAEAHIGCGKMELSLGQVRESIQELESALRINPKDIQARRLLSTTYRRAGDPQSAAKYAQSFASSEGPDPGDLVGDFFLPPWKYPPIAAKD